MRAVKLPLSLPALVIGVLSLCACNTLADRRSLYAPKKGEGYWTTTLHDGTWTKRGTKTADATVTKGGPPAPEVAPAPHAPVATPSTPLPAPDAPAPAPAN
jgi:hypothetical protein